MRDPKKRQDYKLRYRYGISLEDRQRILGEQNGMCANEGCNRKEGEAGNRHGKLVTDHCKMSGIVRGLLCDACNLALGKLDHDIDRIIGLAKYLRDRN